MGKKRGAKRKVLCDGCGRGEGPVGGKCDHCGAAIECDPHGTALVDALRDNLSPEGVAALVMALQPAGSIQATTPEGEKAIEQVLLFRDTLLEMIGVENFNRTMDELGF